MAPFGIGAATNDKQNAATNDKQTNAATNDKQKWSIFLMEELKFFKNFSVILSENDSFLKTSFWILEKVEKNNKLIN